MHWNHTARLRFFLYHLKFYPRSFLEWHRRYWGKWHTLDGIMRYWESHGYFVVPPADEEKVCYKPIKDRVIGKSEGIPHEALKKHIKTWESKIWQ